MASSDNTRPYTSLLALNDFSDKRLYTKIDDKKDDLSSKAAVRGGNSIDQDNSAEDDRQYPTRNIPSRSDASMKRRDELLLGISGERDMEEKDTTNSAQRDNNTQAGKQLYGLDEK